jgi:hypothetical protein
MTCCLNKKNEVLYCTRQFKQLQEYSDTFSSRSQTFPATLSVGNYVQFHPQQILLDTSVAKIKVHLYLWNKDWFWRRSQHIYFLASCLTFQNITKFLLTKYYYNIILHHPVAVCIPILALSLQSINFNICEVSQRQWSESAKIGIWL